MDTFEERERHVRAEIGAQREKSIEITELYNMAIGKQSRYEAHIRELKEALERIEHSKPRLPPAKVAGLNHFQA